MASIIDIVIRANDRASGVLRGIGGSLRGIGGALGMFGRGLVLGGLVLAARSAARAIKSLADEARAAGNFTFITEQDVNTIEQASEALENVRRGIVGAIAAKAGKALRFFGVGDGPSEKAFEQMREQLRAQSEARKKANALLFDALPAEQQLVIAENKLAELRKRGLNDAQSMLEITRQQLAVDKLREQVLEAQSKALQDAVDDQIEQSKVNEAASSERADLLLKQGISRGEAVLLGGRAAREFAKKEKESRLSDEAKMEKDLIRLARLDDATARKEATGALRVSERTRQARLALADLDQARAQRAGAEAELRRQAELQNKRDAIAQQTKDEIARLHNTIRERLGVAI